MREAAFETLVFAAVYDIVDDMPHADAPSEPTIARDRIAGTLHASPDRADRGAEHTESCDYCGSTRLEWRKCKLICADCSQINKSCADL